MQAPYILIKRRKSIVRNKITPTCEDGEIVIPLNANRGSIFRMDELGSRNSLDCILQGAWSKLIVSGYFWHEMRG